MSGLKKLLKRKDKSKNVPSTEDLSQSGREMAAGTAAYLVSKEKDLPKLHKAVWTQDTAKLKQLIKKADINQFDKENRTALHFAASFGNEEMCRLLLANKAKTNLCDNVGRTPLIKAVEAQSHACTELLLESGADAKVVDVMNSTALHLASANGEIDIAVLLIGKGAKVVAQDKEGFTPLHVASSLGYQDFVGFLIHEGASIDAIDAHGRTSLMTAASEGHIGIVKLLLQNNANTEIKDSQGWKASDHAIIQGHHSCSNIIEEHEEKLEAQQRHAPASKAGRKANNNNFSGLLGTDEQEFSFGGPVVDKGAESASGREDESASHNSVGEDSWNSSGGEDAFEVNKKHDKPSLLAALKPVTRSESDVSTHSHISASRIPVRKEGSTSNNSQASKSTPDKSASRIPVPATTASPVPSKKPIQQDKPSTHTTPSNSVPGTPPKGEQTPTNGGQTPIKGARTPTKSTPTLGTPNMEQKAGHLHVAGDVSPSRLSVDGQQSLPWESIQVPSDDESQITESDVSEKVAAVLAGKGTAEESKSGKGGIFLTEPDGRESDLNLTFSDDEDDNLPIDDDGDDNPLTAQNPTSKAPTSAAVMPAPSKEEPKKEDKVPKLDLGSSVSSVSEPDLSGASDKKNTKTKDATEDSLSEDSEWDSSYDDVLPSDDAGNTGGSSLFGSSKKITPIPPNPVEKKTHPTQAPKEDPKDSDSEATETESEWELDIKKKKQSQNAEKAKEEERVKKWEKEQLAREEALALEVRKELEMEIEMERLERQSEEEKKREEEERKRQEDAEENERQRREEQARREEELRLLNEEHERRTKMEEERLHREREERLRIEEALKTLEREKEQERLQLEREKEDELERQMRLKEEEMLRIKKERDDERQRREEEENRLLLERENELRRIQLEKEEELANQMKEKEREIELQKRAYEEKLQLEKKLLEEREADEARRRKEEALKNDELERQRQQELLEKQKKIREEEDKLLDAYRKKQEELLEQERRFEEDMARRERELEERMKKKELERKPVLEEPVFVTQERQVSAEINDFNSLVKSDKDNVPQRKQDIDLSIMKGEEQQLKIQAKKDVQGNQVDSQRRHDQLKAKSVQGLTSKEEEEELQKLDESMRWKKAEKEIEEEQQKAHEDITKQHALEIKIEMEKRQLQSLETRKEILDRQVGAKLTELANRKRREELEEKSRQLMQEREELNASFEAAKKRGAMFESSTENFSHGDKDDTLEDGVAKMRESYTGQEKFSPSSQALSNGYVEDVDWSESSEEGPQTYSPVMQAQMLSSGLPRFQSTTKVDGQVDSPITRSISPIAKATPLSSSFALNTQDAQSVNKLQEALRDSRRQIDKLKERNITLETSRKQLEKDMAEVQGKLQASSKDKADVEHSRLQTESDIRSIRYKCEQESEGRRVAESLLTQLKDQIKRSDERLAKEMETRQQLETEIRHLKKSNKDLQQTLDQQEVDMDDLQKVLSDEQEARVRMTDMYNDVRKQLSVMMEEARTTTHEKAVVMAELEAVDQTRKTHEANSGSLREQLMTAQADLAETKARLEATLLSTDKELAMLREKLQKKSDKLAKAEEALGELRANSDSLHSNSSKELAQLRNKLESETLEKKQLESEIASLKIRLENANNELDKAAASRNHAENQSHGLRDELYQAKLQLEKEIASLRETNQAMSTKLERAENRASSLDQELQLSTLTMTEKGGHLNLAQREVEHVKTNLQRTEEKLALEKGQNAKLSAKLETTENKLLAMMSEGDSLKRQLEVSHDKTRKLEETAVLSDAKYNAIIDALRADLEKSKELLADNKNNMTESIQLLKDDSNKNMEKTIRKEEEAKQLNQDLNSALRKLTQTETALEMQTKAREELENERTRLREQLRVFEAKLLASEDLKEEMSGRANKLEERLDKSMRTTDDTASRLASRSADLESVTRSLAQLENLVNRLKTDKAQLTSALKDEQIKTELLLKEIKDANEARQSLEALLTNVKAENIQLEEKIQNEELSRTLSGKEAVEARELWESELRARTKLGTKIMAAEKKLAEAQAALEEERRKTRKVLEMKKAVEAKLEAQDDRSAHHHKDIVALKTQLKSYKRRLKEYETSEGRIPSLRNEFDKERSANESHISSLRRQIDNLSDKLRQEMEARTRLELNNKQQQQDLAAAKANEKEMAFERDRLERTNRQLEEEIQRTTTYYEEHYVEKGQLDVFKKELETKSRFEINRKLEEINQHLAEESSAREKLDRMREQNVAKTRTEMDQMISDLKNELARSRSSVHEQEAQKDTLVTEAKRYKDLYENELNAKNKLTSRLTKANEKVAESKAMLNVERSRRIQSGDRDSGFVTSPKYSPDPLSSFITRSPRSPNRLYTSQDDDQLMKAVENELNKSIKRHLETSPVTTDLDLRPSPLTISDADTSSYPALTHASKEYMSLLQKKYFV